MRIIFRVFLAVICLCLAIIAYYQWSEFRYLQELGGSRHCGQDYDREAVVKEIISFNELLLTNGQRVRLIGMLIPDQNSGQQRYYSVISSNDFGEGYHLTIVKDNIEWIAQEAASFLEAAVEGRHVCLEFDQQKKDKDGRLLAYVYLSRTSYYNMEPAPQEKEFLYQPGLDRLPFEGKYLLINKYLLIFYNLGSSDDPSHLKHAELFRDLYNNYSIYQTEQTCLVYEDCQDIDCSVFRERVDDSFQKICTEGKCECAYYNHYGYFFHRR